jgi:hypothetical protein
VAALCGAHALGAPSGLAAISAAVRAAASLLRGFLACWLLANWLPLLLAGWLAGWLACLLACLLACVLACWLAGLLAGLLACLIACVLAIWLSGYLAGLLACWLAGLLACACVWCCSTTASCPLPANLCHATSIWQIPCTCEDSLFMLLLALCCQNSKHQAQLCTPPIPQHVLLLLPPLCHLLPGIICCTIAAMRTTGSPSQHQQWTHGLAHCLCHPHLCR